MNLKVGDKIIVRGVRCTILNVFEDCYLVVSDLGVVSMVDLTVDNNCYDRNVNRTRSN